MKRKERLRRLEKGQKNIKNRLSDVEKQMDDVNEKLERLLSQNGLSQPNKKFKVYERQKIDGELMYVYSETNDDAGKLASLIEKKGAIGTKGMIKALNKLGRDVSKPTARRIMKDYDVFDEFNLLEPKRGIRKGYKLKYVG